MTSYKSSLELLGLKTLPYPLYMLACVKIKMDLSESHFLLLSDHRPVYFKSIENISALSLPCVDSTVKRTAMAFLPISSLTRR